MKLEEYLELALKEFPKDQFEWKVSPAGNQYKWFSYDFDDINEWVAKWLQNPENTITQLTSEKRPKEETE